MFGWLVPLLFLAVQTQPARAQSAAAKAPQRPEPGSTALTQNRSAESLMLGIDVLEAQGFAAIRGKRVGLLTHPAGVNRRGESTIDVLRRAHSSGAVKLVALFGPEHGIYGNFKAAVDVADSIDRRTGLPVYSLHGKHRKPTPQMLAGLDAMVIDLQDIGTRSYTFVSAMLYTMAACFENGVEVIVLDRPNPLGGLKVDGPPLDAEWKSYVGAFRVPYVHGLTIGELARMAKEAPGVMRVPGPNGINVTEANRERGRLTVIPMRGWRRSMRWPDTGLRWIPTSQYIQDFAAVVGYPMLGLGTEIGKFSHGLPGPLYPFRTISHPDLTAQALQKELTALRLPGLRFSLIDARNAKGQPTKALYVEVTDWDAWRPTELNFHLMRLAAKHDKKNPFAKLNEAEKRRFLIHTGSAALLDALRRHGARTNIDALFRDWHARALVYQRHSRRYWLYAP
ncbi:DUF1343 domain-containing protein [Cephaloticoccus primus]|uniref:DUF1343 domain-containing protein n=1 Tax=Cephaloticoccus primus TaxID=1548207 RepID=UPI000A558A20|nr:DUF1343 domain-containing protein [Cephaloticoccus primus]